MSVRRRLRRSPFFPSVLAKDACALLQQRLHATGEMRVPTRTRLAGGSWKPQILTGRPHFVFRVTHCDRRGRISIDWSIEFFFYLSLILLNCLSSPRCSASIPWLRTRWSWGRFTLAERASASSTSFTHLLVGAGKQF